jgi:hypothetical protein
VPCVPVLGYYLLLGWKRCGSWEIIWPPSTQIYNVYKKRDNIEPNYKLNIYKCFLIKGSRRD